MAWKHRKQFFETRAFRIGAAVALFLTVAIVFVAPRAKRRYDRWSTSRHLQRAVDFYVKGDYKHAVLDARSVLDGDPVNIEAIRVMAQSLEGVGAAEATQWRRVFDRIKPGDVENTLAWAKDALNAGDVASAEHILGSLKQADRNSAVFHHIAGGIAMSKGDAASAESHWAEAVKLDPNEDSYKLNLATLQVESHTPEIRLRALEVLKKLSAADPAKLTTVLRTMLADATNHGDNVRARKLADMLVSDPDATFADKLTRLATLRKLKDPRATSLLTQLRDDAVSKPQELSRLLMWMNQNDLALLVLEWVGGLPAGVAAKPPVCVDIAEAHARALEWKKLKDMLESASWGGLDFLRHAYLARALAKLDDTDHSADAWKQSQSMAGKNPEALERLASLAAKWGWDSKAEELLWRLAGYERCPRWVLDTLWSASLNRGDTVQLFRLSRLVANTDPKSVATRNNAIFLGLLIRSNEGSAHEMAEALYKEAPANVVVASTFGLSLFQQGRVKEAVALMEKFKPEELREPLVARYYGIFLAAAKQADKAKEYLELGADGYVLREEKTMMDGARLAFSGESEMYLGQLNEAAASKPEELIRLVMWMNGHDMASLVSDWSVGLAPKIASTPAVAAAIAESHARALEWKRLKETTGAASWEELDFLRSAFLARALDRLSDAPAAAAAWQASLAATQDSPDSLERLAKVVQGWGWEEKAGEVLWKLSAGERCPHWAIEALWDMALQRGDSTQLSRAGKLIVKEDSKGVRTRNNAIVHALLIRSNALAVREFVDRLNKEAPSDAAVAAIHALSLYQQGRRTEAMALMAAFEPGKLVEPVAALYHGIFLISAKQPDQAAEYLEIASTRLLLPEEKALIARAKAPPKVEALPSTQAAPGRAK